MTEGESPGHTWLRKGFTLQYEGATTKAKDASFKLPNGRKVTYAKIDALAGDSYGIWKPLSGPTNSEEHKRRLLVAWESS
jgi:hypothetical protein